MRLNLLFTKTGKGQVTHNRRMEGGAIQKRSQRQDEIDRVETEGRFGVLKRRFT